jgi:mannose-6-phosphate isomerase-like protein (cupin superfamily)
MQKIIEKETSEHYVWGDNCDSWVLTDLPNLSIKQESMPIGTREKLHFHDNSQQFFYILKGKATFYIDDDKFIVTSSKGILIQPKSLHFISNEDDEVLDFLVISQPTTNNDRIVVE